MNKSIPIGADIASVNITTRIFIISTIAARGKVGIKDSMASVHLQPLLVLAFVLRWTLATAFVTPEAQALAVLTLRQLLPASVALEHLLPVFVTTGPLVVLAYKLLEPLALPFRNREPLVLAVLSLGQLLPASVALEPLVLAFKNREPLVLAVLLLGKLLLRSVLLEPLVLAYKPLEPLVGEPLPLACGNLKNLPAVRKNRSSSFPIGVSSQIAPPGRSGIILIAPSRFPRLNRETRDRQKARREPHQGNAIQVSFREPAPMISLVIRRALTVDTLPVSTRRPWHYENDPRQPKNLCWRRLKAFANAGKSRRRHYGD